MGVVQIFNVMPHQVCFTSCLAFIIIEMYLFQCICDLELFLHPPEEDLSLLTCYRRAIVNNVVRKNSVLYMIAKHHVEAFIMKQRQNK